MPRGWTCADIGDVGVSGEASFLNGGFQLLASGGDIWESADAFHFASRPLAGDGRSSRASSAMQYTDPWAKAGVMLREDDSAGSKYVFLGLTGQGGSVLQSRSQADDPTASVDGPPAKPPHWLKLVRRGNLFTGFVSDRRKELGRRRQRDERVEREAFRRPGADGAQQQPAQLHVV